MAYVFLVQRMCAKLHLNLHLCHISIQFKIVKTSKMPPFGALFVVLCSLLSATHSIHRTLPLRFRTANCTAVQMHSAWHCNSVPKSKFCRHRRPPPPRPPAPARSPLLLDRMAAAAAECGEYTSSRECARVRARLRVCGGVVCSLKFIVSGEKLIKQRAFEMRMTKGYFRSFGASDVDDGRDNVDCDWRQCGARIFTHATPRRTIGIGIYNTPSCSCGGRESPLLGGIAQVSRQKQINKVPPVTGSSG